MSAWGNPILGRELGALLRSRKVFVAEFVFLALLSLAVYLGWPEGAVKIAARAQRSERLFQIFASVQTFLVALIAPIFSASAFTSEKESRCFEFLYVTPLRRSSIVIGKLISSILVLLIVVLSSAPLTSVCLILGGVSGTQVVGLYLVLLSAALLFGLVGVDCSIRFERTYASLGTSYLIILPVILLLVGVVHSSVQVLFGVGLAVLLLTALVGLFRLGGLARKLSRPLDLVPAADAAARAWEDDYRSPLVAVFRRDRFPDRLLFPDERVEPIPDHVNPVLDRELRAESFGFGLLLVRMLIQVSIALSLLFLVFVLAGQTQYFGYFLICFLMLVGPSLGSSAISLERERKTLDLLVTTGVRARKIIWGKFYVATRLSAVLTLILMPPLLIGLLPPVRVTPGLLGGYVVEVLAVALFVNALGVGCSTVARRSVPSMLATYGIIVVLFAGVHILQIFLRLFTELPEAGLAGLTVASPFMAMQWIASRWAPAAGEGTVAAGARLWGWHLAILLTATALILGLLTKRLEAYIRDR